MFSHVCCFGPFRLKKNTIIKKAPTTMNKRRPLLLLLLLLPLLPLSPSILQMSFIFCDPFR